VSQVTLEGACVEICGEGEACRAAEDKTVCTLGLGTDLKHEYMEISTEDVSEKKGALNHMLICHM